MWSDLYPIHVCIYDIFIHSYALLYVHMYVHTKYAYIRTGLHLGGGGGGGGGGGRMEIFCPPPPCRSAASLNLYLSIYTKGL